MKMMIAMMTVKSAMIIIVLRIPVDVSSNSSSLMTGVMTQPFDGTVQNAVTFALPLYVYF
jgi:hypothetical protein